MQMSESKLQPMPEPPFCFERMARKLKINPAKTEEIKYPISMIRDVLEVPLLVLSVIVCQIKD